MASRLGLQHLAELGVTLEIPGVRWDRYTFPLDGDDDARLEAEAIFKRARKAEWVVITDSAGRNWVFKRGDPAPSVAPTSLGPQTSQRERSLPPVHPVLALPPPAPVDTTCVVLSSEPAVTPGQVTEESAVAGLKFACRIQVKTLRRFLALIEPICSRATPSAPEVRLRIDRDGWSVRAVDPSMTAMVALRLDKSQFEEWAWAGPVEMCVDREKWAGIAKLPKPNEYVTLIYGAAGKTAGVGFKFGYVERTVVLGKKLPTEPKVPDQSKVETGAYDVPAEAFVASVRQAEQFTDHLILTGSGTGLRAKGDGESDQGETVLAETGRGSAKAMYPLDFLGKMARAVKGADDTLSLKLGTDAPLKLGFTVDGSTGFYLLAPRVEEE